jgi:hypothetical protein
MTSLIFDRCREVANQIIDTIRNDDDYYDLVGKTTGMITDYVCSNDRYRRAHISIVDATEERNLWLLHVTIFPHVDDGSPIYGFDIVAGPNKVSGAFHDFSSSGHHGNSMMKWFGDYTSDLSWNKRRELPEWARDIFSKNIVAIGAVGLDELNEFCELGIKTLKFYLQYVGSSKSYRHDHTEWQDFYCQQQRKNPHTQRVLQSLGFTEEEAKNFVYQNLFPTLCENNQ